MKEQNNDSLKQLVNHLTFMIDNLEDRITKLEKKKNPKKKTKQDKDVYIFEASYE